MSLTIGMVTFDSADPAPLAQWWVDVLGGRLGDDAGGWFFVVATPDGLPDLGFQRVEDPTPGKNRVHLDLGADDRAAEVARLVEAGAVVVAEHTIPGYRWTVLADPQGNQFCVGAEDDVVTAFS
jgi:predicted enzyme related to lactoylglutathione lyase